MAVEFPVLPAYLNRNPEASASLLDEFIDGISSGISIPQIRANGTRFVLKRPGVDDETLNVLELQIVVLRGKKPISKKWFATKFVQGQEPTAPDCWSEDGIKPDPSSRQKQCDSCAGCPQNMFGSGTAADGSLGKGKACTDAKDLAVYVNKKGIFNLGIMPTALNRWKEYVKTLGAHGRTPSDVLTVVGFEPSVSFPSYTFAYGGDLPEKVVPAVREMMDSDDVALIIGRGQAALPAPEEKKALGGGESADELAAQRAKKAADEKKAAAKKATDEKKAQEAAAKAEKEAAAAAAAAQDDGFGLDLGGDVPAVTGGLDSDAAAVIDALGLDL